MKKHDEGYALLLVVVTLLVLAILSAALMSMGVRNLKNQKASLDQMVDKYAVQGEMEKQVAQIEKTLKDKGDTIEISTTGVSAETFLTKAVAEWLAVESLDSNLSVTTAEGSTTQGTFSYKYFLTAAADGKNTQISCELELNGTVKFDKEDESDPSNKTYKITVDSLNYTSYNISEGGAGG